MARFNIPIAAVSVSAAQDLYEVVASATRPVWIEELHLDQKTLTSGRLGVSIIIGHTTSGSGGGTIAPSPIGDVTSTFDGTNPVEINNTTIASAGTAVVKRAMCWNLVAGLLWLPVPEHRIYVPPSGICVVRLIDAPSGAMSVTGNLIISE